MLLTGRRNGMESVPVGGKLARGWPQVGMTLFLHILSKKGVFSRYGTSGIRRGKLACGVAPYRV